MSNVLASRWHQAFFIAPFFVNNVDMLLGFQLKADSLNHQLE
jgi:hypothetical protein